MSMRYPVVERITVNPGCCYLCRGNKGPFVDAQRTEYDWGPVYLCCGCIVEMYRSLGLEDMAQMFFSQQVLAAAQDLPNQVKELADGIGHSLSRLADHAGGIAHMVESSERHLREALALREREVDAAERRASSPLGPPPEEDDDDDELPEPIRRAAERARLG